jgi:starch phosphorylase
MPRVPAGERDLTTAASALAERLPEPLAPLASVAYNLRWSWAPGGPQLFESIHPHRWELSSHNPVRMLSEASTATLEKAAADPEIVARAAALASLIEEDLARPAADAPSVGYFCAEFGLHRSVPVYSGGLGALAGDHVKESSDRALPLAAVGLMYHQGYFRQRLDASGWQHEYWVPTDPDLLPAVLVRDDDGWPITCQVPIHGEDVTVQVWRVQAGRIPVFLLDTERSENSRLARWICSQLYVGDPVTRLAQYVLLGVGGVRMLQAMGIDPDVLHLNEGHAAFATLERAGWPGGPFEQALTPRQAGDRLHDAHAGARGQRRLSGPPGRRGDRRRGEGGGVDPWRLIELGRTHEHDPNEPFGVTQFALRTSRAANGVARRHGEVAREMWHPLWADRAVDDVPDRPRHQRRAPAELGRAPRWPACSTAISGRTGPGGPRIPRRGSPWTGSPTTSSGRRATSSARRSWSSSATAAPPTACSAGRAATTSRRPRGRSTSGR